MKPLLSSSSPLCRRVACERLLFARKNSCNSKTSWETGLRANFFDCSCAVNSTEAEISSLSCMHRVPSVPFLTVWGEGRGKKAPQTYVRWFSNEQMGKSGVYKGSNWTPKVAWNVFEIALYTENCAREGKELDINWIEIFKNHLYRERNRIFWISIRILTDDWLFKYLFIRKIVCI